jgi:hypothetical protein
MPAIGIASCTVCTTRAGPAYVKLPCEEKDGGARRQTNAMLITPYTTGKRMNFGSDQVLVKVVYYVV